MFSTFGKDSFHNVFILFKMRTTTCIFDSFFLLISYQKSNNNYLAKTCLQWRFDGQRRDIVLVIDIWFLDGFREPLQSKNLKVLLVHNCIGKRKQKEKKDTREQRRIKCNIKQFDQKVLRARASFWNASKKNGANIFKCL